MGRPRREGRVVQDPIAVAGRDDRGAVGAARAVLGGTVNTTVLLVGAVALYANVALVAPVLAPTVPDQIVVLPWR